GEIPERLLDPADRAPEIHGAALAGKVVIGPVREVADVAGVAADQISRELAHMSDDRVVAIGLRIAFTPAVEAVGRLDLHEEPVLAVARIDDERRDGRHLHEPISLVLAYSRKSWTQRYECGWCSARGRSSAGGAGSRRQIRRADARRRSAQWDAPDRHRPRLPGALSEIQARPRGRHPPPVPPRLPGQGLQDAAAIARAIRSGESGKWVRRTPVAS